MRILVSACLLGACCRYDQRSVPLDQELIEALLAKHELIPVCPEIYGGLSTPRDPAEIQRDGSVKNAVGRDVTDCYLRGAKEALRLAQLLECEAALLKEKSPSCGSKFIYDGSFTRRLIEGKGITAALFADAGIPVFGESEIAKLL